MREPRATMVMELCAEMQRRYTLIVSQLAPLFGSVFIVLLTRLREPLQRRVVYLHSGKGSAHYLLLTAGCLVLTTYCLLLVENLDGDGRARKLATTHHTGGARANRLDHLGG